MANPDNTRKLAKQTELGAAAPKPAKPRPIQREALEETHTKRQKKTLEKPCRKPSILAKAALAAGLTAATFFGGQNAANAARMSSISPQAGIFEQEQTASHQIRPPEEYSAFEAGEDTQSLLGKINGPEMKKYEVDGKPGEYSVQMEGNQSLQMKLVPEEEAIEVWLLSENLPGLGTKTISSHFMLGFRYLGLDGPKLHLAEGPNYVHITLISESAGKHIRILIPKLSPDPEENFLVEAFSTKTAQHDILLELSKLPRIKKATSKELAWTNSMIEKTQEIIDKCMPALPSEKPGQPGIKPVGLLIDEIIAAYEVGLNFMIDSINSEMEGMNNEEKKQFLKKVLPYAMGALLRPYHVSYSGISSLPAIDELVSGPRLDSRALQGFARDNSLVGEYNSLLSSFLDSFK